MSDLKATVSPSLTPVSSFTPAVELMHGLTPASDAVPTPDVAQSPSLGDLDAVWEGLVPPHRLQTVIQEQRQRFPLLDYNKDLVAVCDFNGFLAYLNPIGRELMGLAPDGDLSLFQVRCFTPLTQDLWDEIFTSLLESGLWSGDHILQYGGDPISVKLLVTAHSTHPAHSRLGDRQTDDRRSDDGSTIDCFTIVARVNHVADDTAAAQVSTASQELRRLQHLVSNINDVLFEVNLEGQFSYLSPQFEMLFGAKVADWLGQSPLELIHPDDRVLFSRHIQQMQDGKCDRAQYDMRVQHGDGQSIWVGASHAPILDVQGRVMGFQGSLCDISERKAATEAIEMKARYLERALQNLQQARTHMVQSEKMTSLGQLVAGVAHEINNPVNFIYGNLKHADRCIENLINVMDQYRVVYPDPPSMLADTIEEVDLDYLLEDLPRMIRSMKVGADRIHEIVLSLRNFARLDEAEFKQADLHSGIDSSLVILQNRLKATTSRPAIAVHKNFEDLPLVPCFAGQVNQVFMNLLVNAIDALEEAHMRGQVREPSIAIHTGILGNMAQIRFTDNGPGISESVQERLFDPFFTTKAVGKGTGMGLAISYQIICDKHDGLIKCTSTPEQGTTFELQIPLERSTSI